MNFILVRDGSVGMHHVVLCCSITLTPALCVVVLSDGGRDDRTGHHLLYRPARLAGRIGRLGLFRSSNWFVSRRNRNCNGSGVLHCFRCTTAFLRRRMCAGFSICDGNGCGVGIAAISLHSGGMERVLNLAAVGRDSLPASVRLQLRTFRLGTD